MPNDYPMVAPNFARARSALAKSIGLGRKARELEASAAKTKAAGKRALGPTPAEAAVQRGTTVRSKTNAAR